MSSAPRRPTSSRRSLRGGTDPADLARYLAALEDFDRSNNSVPSSSNTHNRTTTANNLNRLNQQSQHLDRTARTHSTNFIEPLDDFQLALKLQEDELYGDVADDDVQPGRDLDPRYDATQSLGYTAHHALSPWLRFERDVAMAARLAAEEEERQKTRISDTEYVSKLVSEEEERYNQLIQEIESRNGLRTSRVINADGTLEGRPGQRAHAADIENFEAWKQLCQASGVRITKFHVFVNSELERRFEEAQADLRRRGRPYQETRAFHGTAAPNIDNIQTAGFKVGGIGGHRVAHGTACGVGVYLATAAGTSVGYAQGCQKMFACRVLPGLTTAQPMHLPFPPDAADSYFNGGVYVVRRPELVLPCYMIEW